ncbi:MAG TPA: nucleotide sugar dehydrogenase [Chthonomonadaceae bacterium]|nr:nucleotide sugar dehydrogenase [Chthonomonadaceae bacterium]
MELTTPTATASALEYTPGVAGIIGLGYVGLPTAVAAARSGWHVLGFDIDAERVERLNSGASHVADVSDDDLSALIRLERFGATHDMTRLAECDVVLICVPTPINQSKEPDLGPVIAAAQSVARALRPGQLIVLESTTYPGTTVEVVQPILEASGLKAGQDFKLAFAPERLEPGNMRYKLTDIPKVVGGLTPECAQAAITFYGSFIKQIVPVSSPTAAEMVKIYENVFRCVNIAFVNELALLCNRMGLDVWEVIEAASTKPYGFMPFYPGPGLGGHCIPVDPHYLAWKAKHYDFHVKFIELAASINDNMPYFVCNRVASVLNEHRKCINGSRILVLGVTYKRDVADLRESPALRIIELLSARGGNVCYHDPYIPSLELTVKGRKVTFHSVPLSAELLRSADCCVIVTDHSSYDWHFIAEHAPLIMDTRNALKDIRAGVSHAYSF